MKRLSNGGWRDGSVSLNIGALRLLTGLIYLQTGHVLFPILYHCCKQFL